MEVFTLMVMIARAFCKLSSLVNCVWVLLGRLLSHKDNRNEKDITRSSKCYILFTVHYEKLLVPFQSLQHLITFLEPVICQNPAL